MTQDERNVICDEVAVLSMWGHGWVGSLLMQRLDTTLPHEQTWKALYQQREKPARRKSVGVITSEEELRNFLLRGYWLTNWDEDGCSLFNPPPMNGLYMYVAKPLADQHTDRLP